MTRVIAIDGPAGAGKSTVATSLGTRLAIPSLNSGALYRSLAAGVLRRGVNLTDGTAIAGFLSGLRVRSRPELSIDGYHLTSPTLRESSIDAVVGDVAAIDQVRQFVREVQRNWARSHSAVIVEGRDIGTVVFPAAELKIYLHASIEERARRRAREVPDDLQTVIAEITARDALDTHRVESPLQSAAGALDIDTTGTEVDEVVERIADAWGSLNDGAARS